MKVLLFTGAGASVELGIPAMRMMLEQFRVHLWEHRFPQNMLEQIDNQLKNNIYDMEHLIEQIDSIEKGLSNSEEWGVAVDKTLAGHVGVVRREAEWYVLHICERVRSHWARLLWFPTLRNSIDHDIIIATTNYDRSIEIAASQAEVRVEDGFEEFSKNEYAPWKGFEESESVKLLKLHGSTDWYHADDGKSVWKLRHAMPLFGTLTVDIGGPDSLKLTTAAVLPSREKKVILKPYPSLSFEFQKHAREADVAIFIGASLRDPDIRATFERCAARIPTYLVSPRGQYEGEIPRFAIVLKQSASRFLISSLPALLRKSSPNYLRQEAEEEKSNVDYILEWLVIANDIKRPAEDRCSAIERLASSRVGLEREDIKNLLQDDNSDVRTYALGLVQDSLDRENLVEFAQSIASEDIDSVFYNETQLLVELLKHNSG